MVVDLEPKKPTHDDYLSEVKSAMKVKDYGEVQILAERILSSSPSLRHKFHANILLSEIELLRKDYSSALHHLLEILEASANLNLLDKELHSSAYSLDPQSEQHFLQSSEFHEITGIARLIEAEVYLTYGDQDLVSARNSLRVASSLSNDEVRLDRVKSMLESAEWTNRRMSELQRHEKEIKIAEYSVDVGIISGNSKCKNICEYCLALRTSGSHSIDTDDTSVATATDTMFCTTECQDKYSQFDSNKNSACISKLEKHTNIEPDMIRLIVKAVALGFAEEFSFFNRTCNSSSIMKDNQSFDDIDIAGKIITEFFGGESLLNATFIRGVMKTTIRIPGKNHKEFFRIWSRRFAADVPHSCAPTSFARLDLNGKIITTKLSAEPGNFSAVNWTGESSFCFLPKKMRQKYLKSKFGWDACNCDRCNMEIPGNLFFDDRLEEVLCVKCRDGRCRSTGLDWSCDSCGAISQKPGRTNNRLVSNFKEFPCTESFLRTAEMSLSPFHWVVWQTLFSLAENSEDAVVSSAVSKALLLRFSDFENSISDIDLRRNFQVFAKEPRTFLLNKISDEAFICSLHTSSLEVSELRDLIEDCLMSLIVDLNSQCAGSYNKHFARLKMREVSMLVLPIASQLVKARGILFPNKLMRVVCMQMIAETIRANDLSGLKSLANKYMESLKNTMDRKFLDIDSTPLLLAVSLQNLEIVKSLIQDFSCNPVFANSENWTPLHACACLRAEGVEAKVTQTKIMKLLIKYTDQLVLQNLKNAQTGDTLLHVVKDARVAKLLVQDGLDIMAKNLNGDTAVDIAMFEKNEELIQLFDLTIGTNTL